MPYELKQGEKLPHAIRRIAKRQVNRILSALTLPKKRKPDSIHAARKDLKKVRAALRLVRDELGGKVYKRQARHFRKVARALSPSRDAQVQVQTIEKLMAENRGEMIGNALLKLHRVLRERMRETCKPGNGLAKKLESELRIAGRHAKHWPVDRLKWNDLACGIGQTYKRASKAFRLATRTREPLDLHACRKHAKDMWYQLRILKPIQPQQITALAENAQRLGQLLGEDHDLYMIGEAAKTAELHGDGLEAINKLVHTKRKRLQKSAFKLGKKLFSEKPSAFIHRLEEFGSTAKN